MKIILALVFVLCALNVHAQSVADSQKAAVAEFPDLAVEGSAFNKAFLARLTTARATNDTILNNPNWPLILARQIAPDVSAQGQRMRAKSTALDQPDRLKSASEGPAVQSGNPLDRAAQKTPVYIEVTSISCSDGQLVALADKVPFTRKKGAVKGDDIIIVTGLPTSYLVKDHSKLKVRVDPTTTLTQYNSVTGVRTVDSFKAVELPKLR